MLLVSHFWKRRSNKGREETAVDMVALHEHRVLASSTSTALPEYHPAPPSCF